MQTIDPAAIAARIRDLSADASQLDRELADLDSRRERVAERRARIADVLAAVGAALDGAAFKVEPSKVMPEVIHMVAGQRKAAPEAAPPSEVPAPVEPGSRMAELRAWVSTRDAFTFAEALAALGWPQGTVSACVSKLVASGDLERVGRGAYQTAAKVQPPRACA